MTTVYLAPGPFGAGGQFFGLGGLPLNLGTITTYAAGSTTPLATYTTSAGSVQNANPIVLGTDGRPPNEIWITGDSYRFDLKDSLGNLIKTYDDLSTFASSANLTFLQAGAGALVRTIQSKERDIVSAKDFAAVGDDSTNDTAALTAVINTGKSFYLPYGTYKVTAALPALSTGQIIYGDGRYVSVIKKYFNGDLLALNGFSGFRGIGLQGQGATYTGRALTLGASTPLAIIDDFRITDFAGYCIEFTADGSGSQFTAMNGEMYCTSLSQAAVMFANDATLGPARRLINIQCSGGVIADLNSSQNSMIIGCHANGITYGSGTKKALVIGNRFSTVGADTTILGEDNVFSNNIVAGNVIFGLACKTSKAMGNTIAGGFGYSDVSLVTGANANFADYFNGLVTYNTSWTAASVNPTLNNGTLVSSYSRWGLYCKTNISLTIGNTTALGTGIWSFTLPFTSSSVASAPYIGPCRIFRSGVAFYTAVCYNVPGTNTVVLYVDSANNAITQAVPFAWSTSDSIQMQIDFPPA